MSAAPLSSPCVKVCRVDPASRLCVGCGRSLEEIARWGAMSEAERLAVMTGLKPRLARVGRPLGEPAAPGRERACG